MSDVMNLSDAASQIELPDGDRVVLFDRLGKGDQFSKEETARNVFRVDPQGRVKWQIRSQFDADGDPFTQLRLENGLSAYRWDGATYGVDLDTGDAIPLLLER
jgi:hypothetical protein